jgi:hypothetical protein
MCMPVGMRARLLMPPTDLPLRLSAPLPACSRTLSGRISSRSCGMQRRRAACSTATTAAAGWRRPPLQQPRQPLTRCRMPTQCMPTTCSRWVQERYLKGGRLASWPAVCGIGGRSSRTFAGRVVALCAGTPGRCRASIPPANHWIDLLIDYPSPHPPAHPSPADAAAEPVWRHASRRLPPPRQRSHAKGGQHAHPGTPGEC